LPALVEEDCGVAGAIVKLGKVAATIAPAALCHGPAPMRLRAWVG
jgi:hypothetical protein